MVGYDDKYRKLGGNMKQFVKALKRLVTPTRNRFVTLPIDVEVFDEETVPRDFNGFVKLEYNQAIVFKNGHWVHNISKDTLYVG